LSIINNNYVIKAGGENIKILFPEENIKVIAFPPYMAGYKPYDKEPMPSYTLYAMYAIDTDVPYKEAPAYPNNNFENFNKYFETVTGFPISERLHDIIEAKVKRKIELSK